MYIISFVSYSARSSSIALSIFAIIINNFAGNQTVDRQFLELLEADDLPVLGTVPTAAAFKQGAALGKPVYEIAKSGKAALAIENILDEIEEVL